MQMFGNWTFGTLVFTVLVFTVTFKVPAHTQRHRHTVCLHSQKHPGEAGLGLTGIIKVSYGI